MSGVFYTSDHHFGHRFVACDVRKFPSIEEHDETLITNWNKTVAPDDIVFHLGDFSLKHPRELFETFQRLNGFNHLIWGNHDRGFGGMKDSYKFHSQYQSMGWISTNAFLRRRVDNIQFLLSHFPYSGDRNEERFTQYRLRNEGLPLLHGHTHSNQKTSYAVSDQGIQVLQVHVGLDAWNLRPVSQEDILRILRYDTGSSDGTSPAQTS